MNKHVFGSGIRIVASHVPVCTRQVIYIFHLSTIVVRHIYSPRVVYGDHITATHVTPGAQK